MVTLDINKFKTAFPRGINLVLKSSTYEIYQYTDTGQTRFAIIIDQVNIVKPFNTYQDAKNFAERKYGKPTKKRTKNKSTSKRNRFLYNS